MYTCIINTIDRYIAHVSSCLYTSIPVVTTESYIMTPVMGRIKEGELRKLSIHGSVHGQFTLTEDCLQYGHSVSTDLPTCHAPKFSFPSKSSEQRMQLSHCSYQGYHCWHGWFLSVYNCIHKWNIIATWSKQSLWGRVLDRGDQARYTLVQHTHSVTVYASL